MNFQDPSIIESYHAHVYYEEQTFEKAQALCEEAVKRFNVKMGRLHRKPVGPHPMWSCQLSFLPEMYSQIIPWLSLNRNDLTIFVHPNTGNDLDDHTKYVGWLGECKKLKIDMFL